MVFNQIFQPRHSPERAGLTHTSTAITVSLTLLLALLGVAGNVLHLPLVFGIHFIFGSLFAMVAAVVLGPISALIVGFSAGFYTLILWNHPYALIVFSLEALSVAILYRRGIRNLVIADLLFWLTMGAPLVLLFYSQFIGMAWESSVLIVMKQALNGLFNTLIAAGLLLALQISRFNPLQRFPLTPITISDILFQIILTLVLIAGAIPILLDSYKQRDESEYFVRERLEENALQIMGELSSASDYQPETLQRHFGSKERVDSFSWAIFDDNGSLLHQQGEIHSISSSAENLQILGDNFYVWLPPGEMSAMLRWKKGFYQLHHHLSEYPGVAKIILEKPAKAVVLRLERGRLYVFTFLSLFFMVSVLLSQQISHWLALPMRRLKKESEQLNMMVAEGIQPQLPQSRVEEISGLSHSLSDMASQLSSSFHELKQTQAGLEHEVKERTRELNRLSQVAQQTINAVIITNPKGEIEWVNPGFTQITGYTLAEVSGKKPGDFLQGDGSDHEAIARISAAIRSHSPFSEQLLNYDKEKRPYWIHIDGNPIFNENKELVGFIAIEADISRQKKAEEALLQSNLRLRSLFELSPLGIALNDFESGAFIEVNDALITPTGYSREAFLQLKYWDLTPQEYEPQEEEQLQQLKESGRYGPYEKEYIRKDGSRYPVLLRGVLVKDPAGDRIWSIVEDISTRKAQEESIHNINQRLLLAADAAQFGVWQYDPGSDTLEWDDWMYRLYGMQKGEATPSYEMWRDRLHPEDRSQAEEALQL
ncbi:MAG: PAS domain S-box protein, partial [Gammaproteobacteria bacterium]|nr:PAS domain S-box protein [Gammaproteobacteria bacterium]